MQLIEDIAVKKEKNRTKQREWRKNNATKFKEDKRRLYRENKDKFLDAAKDYREKNKVVLNEKNKLYCSDKTNKERRNKRDSNRKLIDTLFKLKIDISSLIRSSFRRKKFVKNTKTSDILGCSQTAFKQHIEAQFQPWMNWENHGNPKDGIYELNKTWDIDHITPIDTAKTIEKIVELNHYTNLRPLCSYVNRWSKRNKITT